MAKQHNAIWYYLTILCLLLSSFMPLSATEQEMPEIIVDPPSFTVNLTGGDTVIKNITVRWTGSDTVSCNISTNVTSNCGSGEGINVTYHYYSHPSPFDLTPNVDYIVEMTIKVALHIMPGIYIITTNFSCEAEEPPEEDEDDDGDGGNGGGGGPRDNIHPIADASAGESYTGTVGEEITFDGSKSFDPDGTIIKWYWDFGDETNGTGKVTNHTYFNPGTYNVTLTVTDNRNAMDSYETTAIIRQPNRPPTTPTINGTKIGNKTIEYTYTAISTDPDNNTIRYFFDWNDDTNTTSDFLASGVLFNTSHAWTDSGVYAITVYAEDINHNVSDTTEMKVFIDMNVLFIDDVIQGYLLDMDNDSIYDVFHNDATGSDTTVELRDNGNYLMDSDGDALWDYEYDPETDTLTPHTPAEEEEDDSIFWVSVIVIVIIIATIVCFVILSLIYPVKKKKKKE